MNVWKIGPLTSQTFDTSRKLSSAKSSSIAQNLSFNLVEKAMKPIFENKLSNERNNEYIEPLLFS